MNSKLSLCLKITNWCNLNCAHCCELSGPTRPKQFMPLAQMQNFITQFNQIEFPKTEYFVIGGGEAMAPFVFGNRDYIPQALYMIYNAGGIPTIKTNATWGNSTDLRQNILKDLARVVYSTQIVTTLDISIDEFHNNLDGAANVIADIVKSQYLAPAIRISLVGFNTVASKTKLRQLREKLSHLGIMTYSTNTENNDFAAIFGYSGIQIFTSFNTPIYKAGRAIETKTYTTGSNTGTPDSDGHCLVVDNAGNAILNYKFRERIAGRDLDTVTRILMQKFYQNKLK